MQYIIVSPKQKAFNFLGENIGVTPKRALFYSSSLGRRRIYRQSLKNPAKGMRLFVYKKKQDAQKLADGINDAYNDTFRVEKLQINSR